MINKLIVALDVPNYAEAEKLVKTLSPVVKIFKVGKELFTAEGPRVVEMVRKHGAKVFLDLKFHDIPNTVAGACASAAKLGVFMMNVHACGGREMMQKAAEAVKDKSLLIGVTVLTSMNEANLKEVGVATGVAAQVENLAKLAKTSGLKGVVCSPLEIELIRKTCGNDFVIVTPGVRPDWAATGDQKRVMTPKEAIQKGADYLVVGRPITAASNLLDAAKKVLAEIQ